VLSVKDRKLIVKLGAYAVVIALLFYLLSPFYWLIISSFQPEGELTTIPPNWIPQKLTLNNFLSFLDQGLRQRLSAPTAAGDLVPGIFVSFAIAILVTMLNLVIGVPAAYAFARFKIKALRFFFTFLLVCRMVPAVAIVIPFYLIMTGILEASVFFSVTLGHLTFTLPFTVWVLRSYFLTAPSELEEAARIDGCSRMKAVAFITLPICTPGLTAAAIFAFMFSWNEFLFALVLTSTSHLKTAPVVVSIIGSDIMLRYGVMNASALMVAIVPFFISMAFGSYLRKGLTAGALK